MADISYTYKATGRTAHDAATPGKGEAGGVKTRTCTIELAASADETKVKLFRIPSAARISGQSTVYWDDLGSSSATLDIGLGSVNSNVTSDEDALNDGLDLATAASSSRLVKDIANIGKRAWEYVSGQTTDPGGELDVYATVKDASTSAAGTISAEILYYLD